MSLYTLDQPGFGTGRVDLGNLFGGGGGGGSFGYTQYPSFGGTQSLRANVGSVDAGTPFSPFPGTDGRPTFLQDLNSRTALRNAGSGGGGGGGGGGYSFGGSSNNNFGGTRTGFEENLALQNRQLQEQQANAAAERASRESIANADRLATQQLGFGRITADTQSQMGTRRLQTQNAESDRTLQIQLQEAQQRQQSQQFESTRAQQQQHYENSYNPLLALLNGTPAGPTGPAADDGPQINAGGVYSPTQIDQQVNASRAATDAAAASRSRSYANDLTGRGYGGNSPLLMAMQNQLQGQALAQNASSERDIRYQAAGANADQLLKTQQAREGAYASRQTEANQRGQITAQTRNALIAALAGLA